jgi:hypothetical protein
MTETTPPPVHVAWSNAMGDLTAIRKGEVTTGGSRYNFRGVDTTMNAVGPVLRTHGLMVIPKVREAKHRDFTGKSGTTMHEAVVTVDYTIHGPAGDTMEGGSIGEAADASDKATAQAMSVAYRIFLLQSMTMPTDEVDPDQNHVERAPIGQQAQQQRPPAQQQVAPPKPEFTEAEAKGAFADLHGRTATVAEPAFSEINGWVERAGITEASITRALARVWHDKITAAPKDSSSKPPTQRDEAGWKSPAEKDQTWESLNERHDLALRSYAGPGEPTQVDKPAKDSFTKAESADWLEAIIGLELGAEPF